MVDSPMMKARYSPSVRERSSLRVRGLAAPAAAPGLQRREGTVGGAHGGSGTGWDHRGALNAPKRTLEAS